MRIVSTVHIPAGAICTMTPIVDGSLEAKAWSMASLATRPHQHRSPRVEVAGAHAVGAEPRDWLRALSGGEPARGEAIDLLHALLLRAARFELRRRGQRRTGDFDDLATQAADDALMAVLSKLHTYRGESRFTTWAYKFALLEAAVQARRRAWQGREVPLEADGWARLTDHGARPDLSAEHADLIAAVRAGIAERLTPHQRTVLVALALNDVPIDVLAHRLGSTRGALYKTLHDARRNLRAHLTQHGHAIDDAGGKRPTGLGATG